MLYLVCIVDLFLLLWKNDNKEFKRNSIGSPRVDTKFLTVRIGYFFCFNFQDSYVCVNII